MSEQARHHSVRTLGQKVLAIVGSAHTGRERVRTLSDVVTLVERRRPVAFTYLRVHRSRGRETVLCSKRLISRRVRLCVDLGLLTEAGQVTSLGRSILNDPNGLTLLVRPLLE